MKIKTRAKMSLLFGQRNFQMGWLLMGIGFLGIFFEGFLEEGWTVGPGGTIVFLIGVGIGWHGLEKGYQLLDLMRTGNMTMGKLVGLSEDRSGERLEYKWTFEVKDFDGKPLTITQNREWSLKEMSPPSNYEERVLLVGHAKMGILEKDLPMNLTFGELATGKNVNISKILTVVLIPTIITTIMAIFLINRSVGFEEPISIYLNHPVSGIVVWCFCFIWFAVNYRRFSYINLERNPCRIES